MVNKALSGHFFMPRQALGAFSEASALSLLHFHFVDLTLTPPEGSRAWFWAKGVDSL